MGSAQQWLQPQQLLQSPLSSGGQTGGNRLCTLLLAATAMMRVHCIVHSMQYSPMCPQQLTLNCMYLLGTNQHCCKNRNHDKINTLFSATKHYVFVNGNQAKTVDNCRVDWNILFYTLHTFYSAVLWNVTPDTWHMTHDTWHMTPDLWHVVGVNILSKFQLSSSYCLGVMMLWWLQGKGWLN